MTNEQERLAELNDILTNKKYTITIAVRDEEMAKPIIESLHPFQAKILVGKDYPSFSKLVNTVVTNSEEEIVIFCSHRVRPTPADVQKLLKLLILERYGVVGLFRFAFFGFRKELVRRVGFFDERFVGGEKEDRDFVIRLKEADISYYESEEIVYFSGNSTWNNSLSVQIFNSKWKIVGDTIKRLKTEETSYNIGVNNQLKDIPTTELFTRWSESKSVQCKIISFVNLYKDHRFI